MVFASSYRPFAWLALGLAVCKAQVIVPGRGQIINIRPTQLDEASCLTADSDTDGAPVYLAQCDLDYDNRTFNATVGAFNLGQLRVFGDKCLDVTNANDNDGTKLQIWTCGDGNDNQNFIINSTDHTIRWNKDSRKCLDLTGGSTADGTLIQIWTCGAGNNNQQWDAFPPGTNIPIAPGGWTRFGKPIPSIHEDGCLTGGATNGAPVTFTTCNPTDPTLQNWTLSAGSATSGIGPLGQIQIGAHNKCLDVTDGSVVDGTKLQVWDCTGGINQQWTVNGDTTIRKALSDPPMCADLTDGSLADGTSIQLWACTKFNQNQQWPGV